MSISKWAFVLAAVIMFAAGFVVRGLLPAPVVHAQTTNHVFELRTYTAAPGKLEALKARFRDHTVKLFTKHGMKHVGYWTPADAPQSDNTLIYVLMHDSREAAQKSWAAFRTDPDWIKARDASQKDGSLTAPNGVQSVFMTPTDFSPLK